jgi:hypothetical protein
MSPDIFDQVVIRAGTVEEKLRNPAVVDLILRRVSAC